MKVVSVINFKGGVGKTTLTSNLGAYVASQGYKVLLVDLDPSGSLTFSLLNQEQIDKFSETKTLKNFFEPILKGENLPALKELLIRKTIGNVKLDLLASHLEMINIDIKLSSLLSGIDVSVLTSNYMKTINYLHRGLICLESYYDLVLIDCPPNFNMSVKNALYASDYWIVPTKLDAQSVRGISQIEELIRNYRDECNKHQSELKNMPYKPFLCKLLGIVPMMITIRNGHPIEAQAVFRNKLKEDYHVFQFVRENPGVFGDQLKNRSGNVVPPVLSHGVLAKFANTTKSQIIAELKSLGNEFIAYLSISKTRRR